MIQQCLLYYRASRVHYLRFGQGEKLLFCFHGYGEDASSFLFLESYIGDSFTLIAPELPHHGKTTWDKEDMFSSTSLHDIVVKITEQENLQNRPLHVIGYSMGGRMALQLAQTMPEKLSKLVLIAPDGLVINKWYRLATQSKAGNKFFKYVMKNPAWFLKLVWAAKNLKLINISIFKFVHTYLDDEKERADLYNRWTGMREVKPDLSTVKNYIREKKIPVRFLYGRFDRIIVAGRAENFCASVEPMATLTIIEAGHQLLDERYAADIVSLING